MRKIVTVTKSPFPQDYEDDNEPPPWSYDGCNFCGWVYDVLLDLGKAGRFPRNVAEAVEVAEGAGYEITVETKP